MCAVASLMVNLVIAVEHARVSELVHLQRIELTIGRPRCLGLPLLLLLQVSQLAERGRLVLPEDAARGTDAAIVCLCASILIPHRHDLLVISCQLLEQLLVMLARVGRVYVRVCQLVADPLLHGVDRLLVLW